nr:hypothetical protein [Blastochloris sulfoviridis]
MAGVKIVEQADHRRGGDEVFLAVDQLARRPRQRAVDVEAGAAVVGLHLAGFAFAQPAMRRPPGIGGVGGIDEIERRLRPAASIRGICAGFPSSVVL